MYYDAISGEPMVNDLVDAAREVEVETFKKHGVYEKRPIGVKWVDANEGDVENPKHRCRLVAKEIKHDKLSLVGAPNSSSTISHHLPLFG